MDEKKPMSLLLIEDDVTACLAFEKCVFNRDDVRLVGITGSSFEGMNIVKNQVPEAIVLDIELHRGKGSGLDFLEELKKTKLVFRPIIAVTTNVLSDVVYDYAHENGADLIFHKKQNGYCADTVINSLMPLRKTLYGINRETDTKEKSLLLEIPEERKKRYLNRINAEMNLIGISPHLNGRKYTVTGILYLLENDTENLEEGVFQHIARSYGRTDSTVVKTIETAIRNAWRKTPIDELEAHYTQRINYDTGLPTPTELIYFYADKIRESI